jgi:formylglycine-generating enzyme required for sulfatase activity
MKIELKLFLHQLKKTPSLALPPNYKPIPVPDAPAISQALQLARALRPLARQIAVGLPSIVDEKATVDRIAETRVWQPVLKPESELWLDVALVFDTSPSMCLWQRLGADLHRLLSRYGEFRDVRVWRLQTTATGNIHLTSRNGTVHKPSELLTGDRRRLVVIVSDCVAPAWHDGRMQKLIAVWSAKLPTVVFQVFPERLWSRTALVRSVIVEFQGKQPGLASNDLQPIARSYWDRQRLRAGLAQGNVRLPIVTFEPEAVSSWAQVLAGDRHARTLGIVWDAPPATVNAPQQRSAPSSSDLKERIDSFFLTASPTSHQLAGLLASAPVITLPIVRLIKQSMLPSASAVHLAEVFMSGLLKLSSSQVPTFENAERIAYQLVDDQVRDRLRAGSLVVNAVTVLNQVSHYVAQGLGKSVSDFKALLRTPASREGAAETEFLNAFATVTAKILRGLGSEFEAIANELQPSESAISERSFPALKVLEFMTAQFIDAEAETETESSFPSIQTEQFTIVTITVEPKGKAKPIDLQPFDFTVATLSRNQTGSSKRTRWIIQRQQQSAHHFFEALTTTGDVLLDMVAIPAGSFLMGSPNKEPMRSNNESPQHEVTVQPLFMGRYPITQLQWQCVANLMPQINRELKPNPSQFPGHDRPVEQVSWEEAVEFCDRLSAHTERIYRLPTEAEWEYACRSGTTTPFHFGKTITPELTNYNGNYIYNNSPQAEYRGETTPVDHFGIANAWGLSDMHGNVWEWCQDHWHDNYEGAPIDGSAWLSEDENNARIIRGGSWDFTPRYCRSATRYNSFPRFTFNVIGFRVVCDAPRTS